MTILKSNDMHTENSHKITIHNNGAYVGVIISNQNTNQDGQLFQITSKRNEGRLLNNRTQPFPASRTLQNECRTQPQVFNMNTKRLFISILMRKLLSLAVYVLRGRTSLHLVTS